MGVICSKPEDVLVLHRGLIHDADRSQSSDRASELAATSLPNIHNRSQQSDGGQWQRSKDNLQTMSLPATGRDSTPAVGASQLSRGVRASNSATMLRPVQVAAVLEVDNNGVPSSPSEPGTGDHRRQASTQQTKSEPGHTKGPGSSCDAAKADAAREKKGAAQSTGTASPKSTKQAKAKGCHADAQGKGATKGSSTSTSKRAPTGTSATASPSNASTRAASSSAGAAGSPTKRAGTRGKGITQGQCPAASALPAPALERCPSPNLKQPLSSEPSKSEVLLEVAWPANPSQAGAAVLHKSGKAGKQSNSHPDLPPPESLRGSRELLPMRELEAREQQEKSSNHASPAAPEISSGACTPTPPAGVRSSTPTSSRAARAAQGAKERAWPAAKCQSAAAGTTDAAKAQLASDGAPASAAGSVTPAVSPSSPSAAGGVVPGSKRVAKRPAASKGAPLTAATLAAAAAAAGGPAPAGRGKGRGPGRPKIPKNPYSQFSMDINPISRLSYSSSVSGDVLGLPANRYPAPRPCKQQPARSTADGAESVATGSNLGAPGVEGSYHSSAAPSEIGDALDLQELNASLPPSNFGTRQGTRQASRVMDSRDVGRHAHLLYQGVDPQVAAEAMQQLLAAEPSQASLCSEASSTIGSVLASSGAQAAIMIALNSSRVDSKGLRHMTGRTPRGMHSHASRPHAPDRRSRDNASGGGWGAPAAASSGAAAASCSMDTGLIMRLPESQGYALPCHDEVDEEGHDETSGRASRTRSSVRSMAVGSEQMSTQVSQLLSEKSALLAPLSKQGTGTCDAVPGSSRASDAGVKPTSRTASGLGDCDGPGQQARVARSSLSQQQAAGDKQQLQKTADDKSPRADVDVASARHSAGGCQTPQGETSNATQSARPSDASNCVLKPPRSPSPAAVGAPDPAAATSLGTAAAAASSTAESSKARISPRGAGVTSAEPQGAGLSEAGPAAPTSNRVSPRGVQQAAGRVSDPATGASKAVEVEPRALPRASSIRTTPRGVAGVSESGAVRDSPSVRFALPAPIETAAADAGPGEKISPTGRSAAAAAAAALVVPKVSSSGWQPSEYVIPEEHSLPPTPSGKMSAAFLAGHASKGLSRMHPASAANCAPLPGGESFDLDSPPQMAAARRRMSMPMVLPPAPSQGFYLGRSQHYLGRSQVSIGPSASMVRGGGFSARSSVVGVRRSSAHSGTYYYMHSMSMRSDATDSTDARFMSVLNRLARTASESGAGHCRNRYLDPYATGSTHVSEDVKGAVTPEALERISLLLPPSRLTTPRDVPATPNFGAMAHSPSNASLNATHGGLGSGPTGTVSHVLHSSGAAQLLEMPPNTPLVRTQVLKIDKLHKAPESTPAAASETKTDTGGRLLTSQHSGDDGTAPTADPITARRSVDARALHRHVSITLQHLAEQQAEAAAAEIEGEDAVSKAQEPPARRDLYASFALDPSPCGGPRETETPQKIGAGAKSKRTSPRDKVRRPLDMDAAISQEASSIAPAADAKSCAVTAGQADAAVATESDGGVAPSSQSGDAGQKQAEGRQANSNKRAVHAAGNAAATDGRQPVAGADSAAFIIAAQPAVAAATAVISTDNACDVHMVHDQAELVPAF